MSLITQDVSLTVRMLVEAPDTDDPQSKPEHVSENISNIFLALTAGSSDLEEANAYFSEKLEHEIALVHPGVKASVVVCSSLDPTIHDGNTCPVHESEDESS